MSGQPASEFWQGRRVLVTGHTGFLGSWLCLWLQRLGSHVSGFALAPPTEPSLFELAGVGAAMHDLRGDIRDAAALDEAVRSSQPQLVFHLAGQALLHCAQRDPLESLAVNALGTANLLEALRQRAQPTAVVAASSGAVYAPAPGAPRHTETDPLGGRDPLGASAACAELAAAGLRTLLPAQVQIAFARTGNAIAGGDFAAERLVPELIRAFRAGKPAALREPRAVRPWLYSLDALCGFVLLAERLSEGDPSWARSWNLGPSPAEESSAAELAQELAMRWGRAARWRELPAAAGPGETAALRLDSEDARRQLGWEPRWSLARALDETAAWYLALDRGADLRDLTARQLEAYLGSRPAPAAANARSGAGAAP